MFNSHVGEGSYLLGGDTNFAYNVNVTTEEVPTTDTAQFEKLYCPGRILHLMERYDLKTPHVILIFYCTR